MKKVIKSRIFIFVIAFCLGISGTLYAATTYKATDVLYASSDGTSMTVNEALNELYNKSGNKGYYYSYKDGTAIYYNPVSGEVCNASEAVSTTGTKTGCMKWYAFNDSSESATVNMILDHNTTAKLAWSSTGKNVVYEESDIKPEVDKLVSESGWIDTPRLISAEEITQITLMKKFTNTGTSKYYYLAGSAVSGQGQSPYAWLYDYTYECTGNGCNIADSSSNSYWTSTPAGTASSGSAVWRVACSGALINYYWYTTGIRPVITVSKSILS